MPEVKLGEKHECYNCSTKFYDLGRKKILCPKCGADQKQAEKTEKKAASSAVAQAARQRRKAELASNGNEDDEIGDLPAETEDDEIDDEEFEGDFDDEDEEEKEDDDIE